LFQTGSYEGHERSNLALYVVVISNLTNAEGMTSEYEYYEKYDDAAMGQVNLVAEIRDWLWTMDLMFQFINDEKPEILEDFSKKVEEKYNIELKNTSFALDDVGFDKFLNDQSVLASYSQFKDLGLQIIMKYIPLREGYTLSEEMEPIRYVDYLRAKHMLLYHRITALTEILGREAGIDFFQKFVQFWGREQAKKLIVSHTIDFARENYVKFWENSSAFNFGVVDVDKAAFLAKFDKCAWYESMKHVDDQELAYYAVCYPGPRIGRHVHQNVSMRRSVTLFTGDFCDELRWDRHVHDEPEQPSHDFSGKIVPK